MKKDSVPTFENDIAEDDNPEHDNSEHDDSEDDDDNSENEDSHIGTDAETSQLKSKSLFVILTMGSWTLQSCFSAYACAEEIHTILWRNFKRSLLP